METNVSRVWDDEQYPGTPRNLFAIIRVLNPLFSPECRPGLGWYRLEYGELFTRKDI